MSYQILAMAMIVRSYFRRSERTAGYSVEETEVAAVASFLAQGLVGSEPLSQRDFERAVVSNDEAVRRLVVFVSHTERRRRHLLSEVDEVLRTGSSRPRWLQGLLGHAYALYNFLRVVAVPQGRREPLQLASGTHIARSLHRVLRGRGVESGAVHSAAEINRLANENLRRRWRQMAGRQVVVWFDNFYRQHFGHNPHLVVAPRGCST